MLAVPTAPLRGIKAYRGVFEDVYTTDGVRYGQHSIEVY